MFQSLEEITQKCASDNKEFWEVIMGDDIQERQCDAAESYSRMTETWDAMLLAAVNYDKELKSSSGLIGGDGAKMQEWRRFLVALCSRLWYDFGIVYIGGSLRCRRFPS